jgi:hypothetical protein
MKQLFIASIEILEVFDFRKEMLDIRPKPESQQYI